MKIISNNQIRLFADVLAVDAWYSLTDTIESRYSVFADVSFSEARIGGDTDIPLYFDLSVRRALFRLHITEDKDLSIPRLSVREYDHDSKISLTTKQTHSKRVDVSASSNIALTNDTNILGSIGLSGGTLSENSSNSDTSITSNSDRPISVRTQTLPSGEFQRHLEPIYFDHLLGRAWPRDNSLLDFLVSNSSVLSSKTIRAVITCKNDDLKIENIRTKDSDGNWLSWALPTPKRAVAAQCIRKSLLDGGLQFRDVENPYCEVFLAEIVLSEAAS